MKHAIATLQIAVDAATNNEPIHRSEGNVEQADHCLEAIMDYQEAIFALKVYQSMAPAIEAALDQFGVDEA